MPTVGEGNGVTTGQINEVRSNSLLKIGKVREVRFRVLARICEAGDCEPGNLGEIRSDTADEPP